MILKIARSEKDTHEFNDGHSSDYIWEYIEKVCNVTCRKHVLPDSETPNRLVTEIGYVTEADRWDVVQGVAHSTTLSGEDVCYLMNDSGKTIERLR